MVLGKREGKESDTSPSEKRLYHELGRSEGSPTRKKPRANQSSLAYMYPSSQNSMSSEDKGLRDKLIKIFKLMFKKKALLTIDEKRKKTISIEEYSLYEKARNHFRNYIDWSKKYDDNLEKYFKTMNVFENFDAKDLERLELCVEKLLNTPHKEGEFLWTDLPDFAIITGANGSGKTLFLRELERFYKKNTECDVLLVEEDSRSFGYSVDLLVSEYREPSQIFRMADNVHDALSEMSSLPEDEKL